MTATRPRSVPELLTEIRAARVRVATLKRTIKHTRQALTEAAAALLELEAECHRRGLAVVTQQPQPLGVGANHGRTNDPRSHH